MTSTLTSGAILLTSTSLEAICRATMESSGDPNKAVSTTPQSNVQWQIDIPSLSQMILRIGAEGLKSIQMSGVDVHTVGCLLGLGEITPASDTFRRKLVGYRHKQRSRRWFLNTVVEYGSGTNAVIDQLLNTRAGENILSLITAVTSVLDDGAIEVMNIIFELLRTPSHSIPGISQLQRVRSTCLPLARMTDFKDRVARMHEMILGEAFFSKTKFRWLMSCGEGGVDFFQLSCGWALKDRQEVGDLTYSIAKEYVEYRVYLGDVAASKQGTPYFAMHLDRTLENLRRILNILGLPSPPNFKEDWRQIHFEKKASAGR
ncbi:hypothetical protein CDV31_013326 [Fusarium ambrosium]|uniref:Uncharacterized protein n=1 Tax=Fusarium ambrosium TaxID=131363 RepID=A0A428T3X2_9HYPO|nr:hypothetical protein CDV31_013326 [Fusarium ambrosium]